MLIIGLLVFGGIYIVTAGGIGKIISNIVTPILESRPPDNGVDPEGQQKESGEIPPKNTELALPEELKKDEEPKITETIKVESMRFYGIQMGAFSSQDNAHVDAKEIQGKGGAGYIIEDQYFRVIAMAFMGEQDADTVQKQLKEQKVEVQKYELLCPGVNMEITASREKVEGIKTSFNLWREKIQLLESVIKDLDNNRVTVEIVMNRLRETKNAMVTQMEEIKRYSATGESNQVLGGLQDLFEQQIQNIDNIISENISNQVAISAKIKYTYIDIIFRYKQYIEQITRV